MKQEAKVRTSLLGAACLALLTCGCQSVTGSPAGSQVRVIDAANSLSTYDVELSGEGIAYGIGYNSVTNYVPNGTGIYTVQVNAAGTTNKVAPNVSATLAINSDYTILFPNQFPNKGPFILTDETAAQGGYFDLRFIQESASTGPVDVYALPDTTPLANGRPIVSGADLGVVSPYISLQPGTYKIYIVPSGVAPKPIFILGSRAFAQGQVRTLVLVDNQLTVTPPVNVLVANDVN